MVPYILWQPSTTQRWILTAVCITLIDLVARLHYITGFAYEFNSFYALPLLASAWWLDNVTCVCTTLFCLADWAYTDIKLGGGQSEPLPLLCNTATRAMTIICVTVILKRLHHALQQEWENSRKDQLTGLCNRRLYYELGATVLEIARRQSLPVTLAFMDLDRFKEVNDTLGHAIGDDLLRTVAAVMQDHFRSEDVLARLGGDEFAAIMPGLTAVDARLRLESLRESIRAAMSKHSWPVTLSIGAASFAEVTGGIEVMLRAADAAMYEAKAAGRDCLVLRACPTDPAA
ncbi:MAG: diguanylate cyclase (GGDEF) domain-containing protein [Solidesulfovibrio magneticus str. Maddingley MBC34]|uniref:diguanylate cyclase n=1 Tax=Solidesulfovibrio magneticus str. Maddingley MBC34 TaxID=1206767 RepID=K6HAP9_9BACT|nr:MAG: diguanylate cyclase (GGDEF) domain-containing protein [Solidesulfovibrio magneticus str. Maddingley MBC34]